MSSMFGGSQLSSDRGEGSRLDHSCFFGLSAAGCLQGEGKIHSSARGSPARPRLGTLREKTKGLCNTALSLTAAAWPPTAVQRQQERKGGGKCGGAKVRGLTTGTRTWCRANRHLHGEGLSERGKEYPRSDPRTG